MAIVRRRVPTSSQMLAQQVAGAVGRLRTLDLQKPPGIAEAINWTLALELLGASTLDPTVAGATIGSVLKYREDGDLAHERGLDWVVGSNVSR